MSTIPDLSWLNRQRTVTSRQLRLPVVRQIVERAWPQIAAAERKGAALSQLPEISFILVSDARIAALHDEFDDQHVCVCVPRSCMMYEG